MDPISAILALAILLETFLFVVYIDRRDDREIEERRELNNRLANPEIVVPPKDVQKTNLKVVENREKILEDEFAKASDQETTAEDYEMAGVGQINPELHRKDGE